MAHGQFTGGGSRKGRPNKHPKAFRDQLRAYCESIGVDPHLFLADLIANTETVVVGFDLNGGAITQPAVNTAIKFHAAKELAQYLEPKLRAIEISGNPDQPLQHYVVVDNLAKALARAYPKPSNG